MLEIICDIHLKTYSVFFKTAFDESNIWLCACGFKRRRNNKSQGAISGQYGKYFLLCEPHYHCIIRHMQLRVRFFGEICLLTILPYSHVILLNNCSMYHMATFHVTLFFALHSLGSCRSMCVSMLYGYNDNSHVSLADFLRYP